MAINYRPGNVWGTAGPYGYEGNTRGDNEINLVGTPTVNIGGREWLRVGTGRPDPRLVPYLQPGDFRVDPQWGGLVSGEAVNRVPDEGGFWNGPGPVMLAGGLLAGVTAPAWAGVGGATGGAGGTLPDSYWGMLADSGTGAVTDAGVTGAGTVGSPTGSWSFGDLFGGNGLPPGTTSVGNLFGDGGSTYEGIDDLIKGGGGMDLSSLLGGTNWLNLLGSLGGGLLQYLGATNAADTQEQAAAQSIAALLGMYNQNRADLAPYREAGYGALGNLTNLTTPGKQLDTAMLDPGYQFRYEQGLDQLNNRLRQAGKFYSGDALRGGQEYAQNFAANEFGNVFNRNAALAGIGQTAVNTGVGAGTTAAGQVSNSLLDAGNARASGYVGGGNAIGGGIGSYINNANQAALLQALLSGRTY